MTIAYNKSDVTFGWNGFNNALTLYYMSQMEEFVSKDHRNVVFDVNNVSDMTSLTSSGDNLLSTTIFQLVKVTHWWRK